MKFVSIVAFVACLVLWACNSNEKKGVDTSNIKVEQLASNIDPICRMDLNSAGINDTATYKGTMYGFCSSHCKNEFSSDPESYLEN